MAIAEGDYSTEIKSKTKDEIGKTLRYIEKMRVSLQKSVGEIEEALKESSTLSSTMEGLGTNVLITNIDEELVYANKQSVNNLENLTPDIRQTFPDFDVNKLMGSSIHQFHKDPSRIKTILNNLKPGQQHKAIISIGDIKLSLNAGGVFNSDGEKLGYYVEWQDVTQQHALENQIQAIANSINTATGDISQGNQNLSERTESQAASIQETTASMQQITERVNDTANSAKEIKELITDSVNKVESGSMQVNETGECLDEIIMSVQEVTRMVNSITQATSDQASGIDEINRAITQMDSFTQQNASLVEEAASASESLKEQSDSLVKVIKKDQEMQN